MGRQNLVIDQLIEEGLLDRGTADDLRASYDEEAATRLPDTDLVDESDVLKHLAVAFDLPPAGYQDGLYIEREVFEELDPEVVEEYEVLPVRRRGDERVDVIVVEPLNAMAGEILEDKFGTPIREYVWPRVRFLQARHFFMGRELPEWARSYLRGHPVTLGYASPDDEIDVHRALEDSTSLHVHQWQRDQVEDFISECFDRDTLLKVLLGFAGRWMTNRLVVVFGQDGLQPYFFEDWPELEERSQGLDALRQLRIEEGLNSPLRETDAPETGDASQLGLEPLFEALEVETPELLAALPVQIGGRNAMSLIGVPTDRSSAIRLDQVSEDFDLELLEETAKQVGTQLEELIKRAKAESLPPPADRIPSLPEPPTRHGLNFEDSLVEQEIAKRQENQRQHRWGIVDISHVIEESEAEVVDPDEQAGDSAQAADGEDVADGESEPEDEVSEAELEADDSSPSDTEADSQPEVVDDVADALAPEDSTAEDSAAKADEQAADNPPEQSEPSEPQEYPDEPETGSTSYGMPTVDPDEFDEDPVESDASDQQIQDGTEGPAEPTSDPSETPPPRDQSGPSSEAVVERADSPPASEDEEAGDTESEPDDEPEQAGEEPVDPPEDEEPEEVATEDENDETSEPDDEPEPVAEDDETSEPDDEPEQVAEDEDDETSEPDDEPEQAAEGEDDETSEPDDEPEQAAEDENDETSEPDDEPEPVAEDEDDEDEEAEDEETEDEKEELSEAEPADEQSAPTPPPAGEAGLGHEPTGVSIPTSSSGVPMAQILRRPPGLRPDDPTDENEPAGGAAVGESAAREEANGREPDSGGTRMGLGEVPDLSEASDVELDEESSEVDQAESDGETESDTPDPEEDEKFLDQDSRPGGTVQMDAESARTQTFGELLDDMESENYEDSSTPEDASFQDDPLTVPVDAIEQLDSSPMAVEVEESLSMLDSADAEEAFAAAEHLATAGKSVLPELEPMFPGRLYVDRYQYTVDTLPPVEEHGPVLETLVRIGESSLSVVKEYLDDSSNECRFYATYLLTELPAAPLVAEVRERLFDRDQQTREIAGKIVFAHRHLEGFDRAVIGPLRDVLRETDEDFRVETAADNLRKFKDLGAVPLLIDHLQGHGDRVREVVHEALREITFQPLSPSPSEWRQWWADADGQPRWHWLVEAMNNSDDDVRYLAFDEIEQLPGVEIDYHPEQPPKLRERAQEQLTEIFEQQQKQRS